MKVLVLGGAGFLGYTLTQELLKRKDEVVLVDFPSALENNFNVHSLQEQAQELGAILHVLPSSVTDVCEAILAGAAPFPIDDDIDQIYNLATRASVHNTFNDPVGMAHNILDGTVATLHVAKRLGATLLHTSTSEMYGDPTRDQHESYTGNVDPMDLRSSYSEAKRMSETFCMAYNHQENTDARIVRIFNSYGAGMSMYDGRVVAAFFKAFLSEQSDKTLMLHGGGSQARSFCYVEDTIGGFLALMNQPKDGFKGAVNIGNPSGLMSMVDLYGAVEEVIQYRREEVKEALGHYPHDVVAKETPLPNADPAYRKPIVSTAKEKLGWEPSISFLDGLNKYLDYCLAEEKWHREQNTQKV